jgi:hypothetical protein
MCALAFVPRARHASRAAAAEARAHVRRHRCTAPTVEAARLFSAPVADWWAPRGLRGLTGTAVLVPRADH